MLRKTKQKALLAEEVNRLKAFFSAEHLYEKVKKKDAHLGIATVYRFLKQEVKEGRLFSYQCDRRSVYSRKKDHCHYTCTKTGKIVHFHVDSIDFLKDKIPGSIESFQIEVTGVCDDCH